MKPVEVKQTVGLHNGVRAWVGRDWQPWDARRRRLQDCAQTRHRGRRSMPAKGQTEICSAGSLRAGTKFWRQPHHAPSTLQTHNPISTATHQTWQRTGRNTKKTFMSILCQEHIAEIKTHFIPLLPFCCGGAVFPQPFVTAQRNHSLQRHLSVIPFHSNFC